MHKAGDVDIEVSALLRGSCFMRVDWSIYSASAEAGVESRVCSSPSFFCTLLEFLIEVETARGSKKWASLGAVMCVEGNWWLELLCTI